MATTTGNLLQGQRVVVTGAARGIGAAIAAACGDAGARVLLVDRLGPELQETAARLRGGGLDARAHVCELTDPAAVRHLFEDLHSREGAVDGLVNNAGTTVYGGALDTSLDDLRRTLDIHLVPTLLCSQAVAPAMLAAGHGHIVNMSSAAGLAAVTRFFAYAMAKAALVAMTQQMAAEFGARGVTVNALAPGPVLTEALKGNQNLRVQQALRDDIPMARFASPEEVAGAAVFLLSGLGSYVNGHVLAVDGGLLATRTRLDRLTATAA